MYQVLARKYRPRNFIELVGQNHVSRALTSALERGRLHHAYLFTGTRGVGKTTIARILAKCLNCETGVTSTPCEVCPTCTAVNEGRFIDLIEIDAASRTKVEDTRELLDNVPYAPTQGRFKVYLIDEVHMLSTHSFNALLKTLEEPPEHVKFLFATTDPQKLPITVISRCLQFTLRPLAVDEITEHLTNILQKESIQAETDAIWQIAESAQGSLRDALSLTDQAIAYGQGQIQHRDVKEMLGLIDRTIIFDLILAIHQNQRAKVSALLMQFRQQALDVSLVLDQFISTLHELALLQYLPDLSLKYSAEINQKIMQLSQLVSAQDLQLYYQIACKGRSDLQMAVTQEQGFEMCVLRLLAFRPLQPNEVISSSTTQKQIEHVAEPIISETIIPAETDEISTSLENLSDSQDSSNQDEENTDLILFQQMMESEGTTEETIHLQDDELPNSMEQNQNIEQAPIADLEASNSIEPEVLDREGNEVELDSFGADFDQTDSVISTVDQEDIFFLNPNESNEPSEIDQRSADKFSIPTNESLLANQQNEVETDQFSNHPLNQQNAELMPQDILKLQEVELEGDWSIEKWEYWFRNSQLTPAVQELAQQGLMQGTINGQCEFIIPEKYESLLQSLLPKIEVELQQNWPKTQLSVKYGQIESQTPYALQEKRKVQAFARAKELIEQESVIKDLSNSFGGEIHNIQLKP